MKTTTKIFLMLLGAAMSVINLFAQNVPDLKRAASYSLLSGQNITVNDSIYVHGKVGANNAISNSNNIAAADSVLEYGSGSIAGALSDLSSVIDSLDTLSGVTLPSVLGDTTLTPGVYTFSGNATITGGIFLNADTSDIYIFNVID